MKSPEKVMMMLEALQEQEDDDIAEALPIAVPAPMLRTALMMVAQQLPEDAGELDGFLTQVGEFCLSMRSDPEAIPAATDGTL